MDAPRGAIWFFGDLDDPWVASIADAIPAIWGVKRYDCAGDLPERPFENGQSPALAVVHRGRITGRDFECLRTWRDRATMSAPPALILCTSPYLRYEELERALFLG